MHGVLVRNTSIKHLGVASRRQLYFLGHGLYYNSKIGTLACTDFAEKTADVREGSLSGTDS